MEPQISARAKSWVANEHIEKNWRDEIYELIEKNDEQELTERFHKDLEFGTGGMRSILAAGTNRINPYNVRRATQAMAMAIKKTYPQLNQHKVALSYDSRRLSFELAQTACEVLAANNIHAYIYKRMNPVALLSFSIRHHQAQAGIMVTASHNPPAYNGFKAFWSDGAQVTPPHDQNIIQEFNLLNDDQVLRIPFEEGLSKKLIHWVGQDVEDAYFKSIAHHFLRPDLVQANPEELSIVYTPIHGTGLLPCTRVLRDLGFNNVSVVREQAQGDGSFPTVSSPNPENPEALKMAVDLMLQEKADIVFGSDPDTDRLGVAVRIENDVTYLNGNQIGVLMLHYLLSALKEKGQMPNNPYFVKTIVTTPLQEKIAHEFGVKCYNTLTGFKWICGKVTALEKSHPEENFVFGTEESYGYLNHPYVRDKDGVSSLGLMAEIALYYKTQGINLLEALDQIYENYGFSADQLLQLNYEGVEGAQKIDRIMKHFRDFSDDLICGQKISIREDYQISKRTYADGMSEEIDVPSSNVLSFHFDSGDRLFLRPSGTEPKIKFYLMIQENEGSLREKKARAQEKITHLVDFLREVSDKA